MLLLKTISQFSIAIAMSLFITGCASTGVSISPSPQVPVCSKESNAIVLWTPLWRINQKDAAERELAAAAGIHAFFANSACFASYEIRRIPDVESSTIAQRINLIHSKIDQLVVIGVRELGPTVKLLSSIALVESGTEVALQISVYSEPYSKVSREFLVHWAHGGAGIVKGVASLPSDMQAALHVGLQSREVK